MTSTGGLDRTASRRGRRRPREGGPAAVATTVPRERGSGTVLMAAAILLAAVVAAALLVVAGYVAAVHRARAAADLVALSAATMQARGGNACQSAGRMAAANGVRLRSCRVRGDSLQFKVAVAVERPVEGLPPPLPGGVTAQATAGRVGLLP